MGARTRSATSAFHAHALVGFAPARADLSMLLMPPSRPPSPSIILFAITSTKFHSLSLAKLSASRRAASTSRGFNSEAF